MIYVKFKCLLVWHHPFNFPGETCLVQFSSVTQSCPTFVTPWTAACQASLSFTTSQNLLKLMSIESVMPANCLILCHPLLLLPLSNTLAIWQNLSRELRFNPRVVLSACISQQIKPSLISTTVFFISSWFLFIFSVCYKPLTSHFVHPFFSHVLWSSSQSLNNLSGRLSISSLLSFPSGGLPWPFGTCSSVASLCLNCCFYFSLSGRLVAFPDLRNAAFCGRCPMHPSSIVPSDH